MAYRTNLLVAAAAIGLGLCASPAAAACSASSLDGKWHGSDGYTYFMRVYGNKIWWYGASNKYPEMKSVLRGTVNGNVIDAEYVGLDGFSGGGRMQIRTIGMTHMRRTDAGAGHMRWWRPGCPERPLVRIRPR